MPKRCVLCARAQCQVLGSVARCWVVKLVRWWGAANRCVLHAGARCWCKAQGATVALLGVVWCSML